MTTTINESMFSFDTSLANASTSVQEPINTVEPTVDYSVPVAEPVEYASVPETPSYTYIYPINVKMVGSQNEEEYLVDVEFSVSCSTSNVPASDYKLIKRLKFDKNKLIQDAINQNELLNATAKIVEQKKPDTKINQRFLELAGVKHSKNFI